MANAPDDERTVDLSDEDLEILPDVTADELDIGWGENFAGGGDDRFLDDLPPHWG